MGGRGVRHNTPHTDRQGTALGTCARPQVPLSPKESHSEWKLLRTVTGRKRDLGRQENVLPLLLEPGALHLHFALNPENPAACGALRLPPPPYIFSPL